MVVHRDNNSSATYLKVDERIKLVKTASTTLGPEKKNYQASEVTAVWHKKSCLKFWPAVAHFLNTPTGSAGAATT